MKYDLRLYYLENDLYAYTIDDALAKEFEQERNMKLFKKKEKKISPKELSELLSSVPVKQLVRAPYETKDNVILTLSTTYWEDTKVTIFVEDLESKAENLMIEIAKLDIKRSFKEDLLHFICYKKSMELDLDIFEIFLHLFRNTFMKENFELDT